MRKLLLVAMAALLAVPASALGATRYAAPGGGEAEPCLQAAPCSLAYAIEFAEGGDEVRVGPGTYSVAKTISANEPLTVRGVAGPGRPRIVGGPKVIPFAFQAKVTISDLGIEGHEAEEGAFVAIAPGDVLERVEIVNSGTRPELATVFLGAEWTVTDSLIVARGPGASPFVAYVQTEGTGVLRNDTLVGEGEKSHGLVILGAKETSSIAIQATDVVLSGETAAIFEGTAGSKASVVFDHSDVQGEIKKLTAVSSTDTVGAPPVFVNAAAGDYREAPGSPTIEAGLNDPANGPLDLDANPRSLPATINCALPQPPAVTDVGAYEFVPAQPSCPPPPSPSPPAKIAPPETVLTRINLKGRNAKITFHGAGAAATGFECRLDGKSWSKCISPVIYKGLQFGTHVVLIRAVNAAGPDPTPVRGKFKVRKPHHHRRLHHHGVGAR